MENLGQVEGLSPLIESAIRLNEIYKSLIAGGFTSDLESFLIEVLEVYEKHGINGHIRWKQ